MKIFYENWSERIHVARRTVFFFANHMHNEVEIIYLTKGILKVCCNGAAYRLKPGELFIVFPNLIHSYSHTEIMAGYFAIFKSDILHIFGGEYPQKYQYIQSFLLKRSPPKYPYEPAITPHAALIGYFGQIRPFTTQYRKLTGNKKEN